MAGILNNEQTILIKIIIGDFPFVPMIRKIIILGFTEYFNSEYCYLDHIP